MVTSIRKMKDGVFTVQVRLNCEKLKHSPKTLLCFCLYFVCFIHLMYSLS